MHYILIFWREHEGPYIFMLKNAVATEVREIERLLDIKDTKEKKTEVYKLYLKCLNSPRFVFQPEDTHLNGCVRYFNFQM